MAGFAAAGSNPNFTYGFAPFSYNPHALNVLTTVPTGLTQQGANAANSATNELLTTLGNTVADTGQAAADTAQEQGYAQEAAAYGSAQSAYGGVESAYGSVAGSYQTAAEIANNNATLEASAGKLEQYQQGLQANQTIGTQRATVAASGFGGGGSALSLLAASSRQAALGQATTGLQTAINVGGYQEQAASAQGQEASAVAQEAQAQEQATAVGAQEAAANGAATAAGAAATSATQSANFNSTIAANEAANIASLSLTPLNNVNMPLSEANSLGILGPAGGDIATASAALSQAGQPQPVAPSQPSALATKMATGLTSSAFGAI